ncbi:MAG: dTMP kinase [Pseudomonadales bacterium]|nr:dTMP kinase [Pseudomonadales bacterium]
MTAKFITIEGVEGVGKTTNIQFIESLLEQQGIEFITTREPGGTPLAESLRSLLLEKRDEPVSGLAELLMIFSARAQHLEQKIIPALEKGVWVVCDRFTDATYAYQGGGRGLSVQVIEQLEQMVQGDLRPDLTLVLDLPVEQGMKRVSERTEQDRFENEDISFFHKVRDTYLSRIARQPERYALINAAKALDIVQLQIMDVFQERLFND